MATHRPASEAIYELEVIRPAQDGQTIDLARIPSLVPSVKDSKTYLERAAEPEEGVTNVAEVEEPAPDGGREAWTAVFACYVVTCVEGSYMVIRQTFAYQLSPIHIRSFFYIGTTYAFGVIQSRLTQEGLASSSTLSFAGGLTAACISFFAIINSNIIKRYGSKSVMMVGIIILGLGEILSGWTITNIGGFFVTVGFIMGIGTSLIFMVSLLFTSSQHQDVDDWFCSAMHVTPIPILFETPRTGSRDSLQRWRNRRRSPLPRPGRPFDSLRTRMDV
jgi:hypothetical protein